MSEWLAVAFRDLSELVSLGVFVTMIGLAARALGA